MKHMETDRAANGEQEALGKIQDLASQAAETMRGILENPKASIYTQIQVIGKVLERTYGKPETMLNLEAAGSNLDEERENIHRILERIQI
jgi:hypothetical protein